MTTPFHDAPEVASGPCKGSVRDQVYQALKEDILGGTFDMGERLNENQMIARYGVSRAPLREALTMLQRDGLLEVVPRVGYITSRTTPRDIMEIFELRMLIEAETARKAALSINEEELRRLETLCSPFQPGDPFSRRRHLDENMEFHHIIAMSAGNVRMVRVLTQLMEHMLRLIVLRLNQSTGEDVVGEHLAMIQAFRDRDPDQASNLMTGHLTVARQATVDAVLKLVSNRHL
jgi:GntR family transcriptional regulator, rspAB operon transcriptional repressor